MGRGPEEETMKKYYIYNISTDEFYGTVEAASIIGAELKAIEELDIDVTSDQVAAFSEMM